MRWRKGPPPAPNRLYHFSLSTPGPRTAFISWHNTRRPTLPYPGNLLDKPLTSGWPRLLI